MVRREVDVEEIGLEEVETLMHKMKKSKATGAGGIQLEMLEMAGEEGRLLNVCMQEGRVPKEWRMGLIVPIYGRGKGICMTQESTEASHYSAKY